MPSVQRTTSAFVTADVAASTGVETVAVTLGGISTWAPDNVVRIIGWVQLATGVGVTGCTLRIRRTNLTGAVVGETAGITVGASVNQSGTIEVEDSPGDVAGLPYVLTVVSTGGGTVVTSSELLAIVG